MIQGAHVTHGTPVLAGIVFTLWADPLDSAGHPDMYLSWRQGVRIFQVPLAFKILMGDLTIHRHEATLILTETNKQQAVVSTVI